MSETSAGVHARVETRPDGARVGWVTLDNPGKINIVNSDLCRELCDAIGTLSEDDDLRAFLQSQHIHQVMRLRLVHGDGGARGEIGGHVQAWQSGVGARHGSG